MKNKLIFSSIVALTLVASFTTYTNLSNPSIVGAQTQATDPLDTLYDPYDWMNMQNNTTDSGSGDGSDIGSGDTGSSDTGSGQQTVYVCCDYNANNAKQGWLKDYEECDNSICTYDSSVSSDPTSDTPSTWPSDAPSAPPPEKYCAEPTAKNVEAGSPYKIPSYTEPVCQWDDVCGEEFAPNGQANKNYNAVDQQGERNKPDMCETCAEYVCCRQNSPSYVPPDQRGEGKCGPNEPGGTTCRTDSPTCKDTPPCNPAKDPSCTVIPCDIIVDPECDDVPGLSVTYKATCTVTQDFITGTGYASYSTLGPADPTDAAALAIAAQACAQLVNVYMPLNSPQTAGIFTYELTSVDYCQNITGDQHGIPTGYSRGASGDCLTDEAACAAAGGMWLASTSTCVDPEPICGTAASGIPVASAPSSNLCNPGTASSVTESSGAYNWTCTDPDNVYASSCSVPKCSDPSTCLDLCNNISGVQDSQYLDDNNLAANSEGQCYPADGDLCSNITGPQGPEDLVSLALIRDEHGKCWDSTRGACGSAMNSLTWYNPPQNDLCAPGSNASAVTITPDDQNYTWTCTDPEFGNTVGNCSVYKLCRTGEKLCHGACIPIGDSCNEISTTTLITLFKVEPKTVPKITDMCLLSWKVDLTVFVENSGCTVDGVALTDAELESSKYVRPGQHNMYCHVGDEFQTKQVKCNVNPDFREI